ncbi:uncharacterized protein [Misgurnus anguillicaudatus]|uniref:uncharacterized protein isoform X2 n=1 Tax=Misgurnus anguillicaudatus TaxID=75329 RepID=UPI003CCF7BAE
MVPRGDTSRDRDLVKTLDKTRKFGEMELQYGKHSMLTPEERSRRHLYCSKPRFMRAQPGEPHPLCRISHPGRRVNSKAWQLGSRPHQWRNTAPSYYFCFVKQAVLWNRGQHHTVILRQNGPLPMCSRFHAHMEACPIRSSHPYFPKTQPRPQPIHLGQKQRRQSPSAPHHQAWPDNRRTQSVSNSSRRQFAVNLPHVPPSPNPSEASLEPPVSPSPTFRSVDHPQRFPSPSKHIPLEDEDGEDDVLSPPDLIQRQQEKDGDEAMTPSTLNTPTTPSVPATPGTPATPSTPGTPTSCVTPNSLSDFSRPASSQFSRSTDLNSSFSDALSVNFSVDDGPDNGSDDDVDYHNQNNNYTIGSSTSPPDPQFSSPGSCGRATSQMEFPQPGHFKPTTFQPDTPIFTRNIQPQSPQLRQASDVQKFTDETLNEHPSPSRSSLSPKLCSQSRQSHFSEVDSRSEWNLWPVLPPIMSQPDELQGENILEGTPYSKSSRSQSDMFAELDDLAPRSDSCGSLDHPAGSETDRSSPTTDLSPGLAALTVGCDSGDLGSLSRVQLLLFERRGSESPGSVPSPDCLNPTDGEDYEPGLRVWSSGIPQYYQSTVVENHKPLSGRNTKLCEAQDSLVTLKGYRHCPELISEGSGSRTSSSSSCSINSRISESSTRNKERPSQGCKQPDENDPIYWSPLSPSALLAENSAKEETTQEQKRSGSRERAEVEVHMNRSNRLREKKKRKKESKKTKELKNKALEIFSKLQDGKDPAQPDHQSPCAKFEDFDFLAKYCILSQEKLSLYKKAFEAADSDGDGYLSCLQVLVALKEIIPAELLTEDEEIYVYRILELVDFRVTDGLTDLRLFAVVASLAQKIATLDEFMRTLISKMDFKSLEMKLYKAKLFMFLLEAQTGGAVVPQGCIDGEHLLVELKAGGIRPEDEASVRRELRGLRSLDLLDFLAHLPLFILIHNSVIANPFDDSSNL